MGSNSGNPIGKAVVGQSGGPTAVINQSLVAVIKGLRGHPEITGILGMRHGVRGLVNDQLIPLEGLHDGHLSTIAATPSAALGSTRDKPDAEYCTRIFAACAKHRIHYFFYIGGNDSSDTCRIVNDMARQANYELRCFHIPKTIDNDLPQSDHTPGYPSAAKFVAQAFIGDNLDNRALPGVKINIIMGRNAGWLAAASVLARKFEGDGPHLIYLPEVPFDEHRYVDDVREMLNRHGRCLVAASEGIRDASGTLIATKIQNSLDTDAHGNVQLSGSGALGDHLAALVKNNIPKSRVRADTYGYLQRSFCGITSEIDEFEARSCGYAAAQMALSGDLDGSLAIRRVRSKPYESVVERIELNEVAALTRTLPPEYLDGHRNVSKAFIDFLRPLVGKLPVIGYLY